MGPRLLLAAVMFGLLTTLAVAEAQDEEGAQTIGDMHFSTPNYQLVVWGAGHFAIKVGGSWMPGCVCLNLGQVAQYQTDHLSYMSARAEAVPGGRRLTITGRLTPDLAFTQTSLCLADRITLTYEVRALRDLSHADIRITAGPQIDQMKGHGLDVVSAAGAQAYTWPVAQALSLKNVASLVWHDVGKREARTVFEQCAASQVSLSEKSAVYVAWLRAAGPMKLGETAQATMRFEATPIGDAGATVAAVQGKLGLIRFGVSGKNGLLNNLRTDQGLLIQQLSINEQDMHQVQVGQGRGSEWGGVRVSKEGPGPEYDIEGAGAVINDWSEKIAARELAPGREEVRLTAHRQLDKGPQRLRLLMYVAQWLEQERVPFFLRLPDGKLQSQDAGEGLWFGMPPKSNEAGLGPYRVLGKYPAGTEVVVPMLSRGELMTVRLNQPAEISGFRFEVYFRGLWFQALDNKAQDLDVQVTVEKLTQRTVGTMQVAEDPFSGAVKIGSGGIPLLEGIVARDEKGQVVKGEWRWTADANGGQGTLTAQGKTVEMRVPEHLWGKPLYSRRSISEPVGGGINSVCRLGQDGNRLSLSPGVVYVIAPSALERFSIGVSAYMRGGQRCSQNGACTLVMSPAEGEVKITFRHERVSAPTPDPITSRPAADAGKDDPGVYGGLSVKRDTPKRGDVTVVTPWWEVVHRPAQGGAISSIRFFNGTGKNILQGPVATTLLSTRKGDEFSDVRDLKPTVAVEEATPTLVRLRVTGHLVGLDGKALCPFEHIYEYRPMLVRRTCRYAIGDKPIDCYSLSVGSLWLQSWLDEAAWRHTDDRTSWGHAVLFGPAPFDCKDFSQYMCLFQRGVEGIDWVPAADLGQWWGVGGRKDGARYAVAGGAIAIEPISVGWESRGWKDPGIHPPGAPAEARPVQLSGTLQFDSYLSLPQTRRCLQRRNFVACLSNGECGPEMLKECADYGVTDIMLGAGNNPGSFELTDLKASQKTVQAAARYGIKVYPFDPFQLVNRRAALWQQHDLMARMELRGGKPQPAVFSDYGDYFCPTCKEFRDALKTGYKKLVESANFGGLYHDFTHPYTCYNTKHYPAPHINTDGVLDVILWDREFLGKDRVFCGHTGWVPVLFFQDLCTVTAIFEEYPSTEPLPLYLTPAQGEFVNAAQRTLVSSFLANGAGAPGEENPVPPPELVDAYLSRCALVGIFPWMNSGNTGAGDSYDLLEKARPWLRLFALRGDCDLGTMQFLPWHRQTAVVSDNPFVRAATYWNADRAVIILANSEASAPAEFGFTVLPAQFGWAAGSKLTLTPTKGSAPVQSGQSVNSFRATLPGFGWSAYEVTRG